MLLPDGYRHWMDLFTKLQQIETIEVKEAVGSDGRRVRNLFVINVYEAQNVDVRISSFNTISSKAIPKSGDDRRTPDVQTERTFATFLQLRTQLHRQAYHPHHRSNSTRTLLRRCDYCHHVIEYVLSGKSQPVSWMKWLSSNRKTERILTQFIKDVLTLALMCKASCYQACPSQAKIPEIVRDFLYSDPLSSFPSELTSTTTSISDANSFTDEPSRLSL